MPVYPKERPPLPEQYRAIYEQHYIENRSGDGFFSSIASGLETWMHRRVASRSSPGQTLLEIGAGSLNHVKYEKDYRRYDAVEPFEFLYRDQADNSSINKIYKDILDIDSGSMFYDRIFSIAVLEHVDDLPAIIRASKPLLKEGGIFQAAIPSEGGLLRYLAWRYGTGLAFKRRFGLDYRVIMQHEHLNKAKEIEATIGQFMKLRTLQRFPAPGRRFFILHVHRGFLKVLSRDPRCRAADAVIACENAPTALCATAPLPEDWIAVPSLQGGPPHSPASNRLQSSLRTRCHLPCW